MYHSENLAAPALRRLGRAGLEAPPLRGQKILSFLATLERHFPYENHGLTHTSSQRKSEDPAKSTYSIFAFFSRPCRSER